MPKFKVGDRFMANGLVWVITERVQLPNCWMAKPEDEMDTAYPLAFYEHQMERIKMTGNVKKPHKHADIIKAWADGAIIQFYSTLLGGWMDVQDNAPLWDEDIEYRVKPKIVHRTGNRYCRNGVEFILAYFEWGGPKASLISLLDGNRWNEPVEIKDTEFLSEDEWNKITSEKEFQLIE